MNDVWNSDSAVYEKTFFSYVQFPGGYARAFRFVAWMSFFSLFIWMINPEFASLFDGAKENILEGQWWRLWSTIFVHADLGHLLGNALMIIVVGGMVGSHFGEKAFPYLAVFVGGFINLLTLVFYPTHSVLIGASGVVYYLWGFWFVLFLILAKQYRFGGRLLRVLGTGMILLLPTSFDPKVSYLAHLIGFLFGIGTGLLYYLWKSSWLHSFEQKVQDPFEQFEEEHFGPFRPLWQEAPKQENKGIKKKSRFFRNSSGVIDLKQGMDGVYR